MEENIFETTRDRLQGFCPVDFNEAFEFLMIFSGGSELIKALQNIYPGEDIKKFYPEGTINIDLEETLEIVNSHICPIDVSRSYEIYINGCEGDEDPPILFPAPINIFHDWCWDYFEEILKEPPPEDLNLSLDYFVKWMDLGINKDVWNIYSRHFGWYVPYPQHPAGEFYSDLFDSLLKENGLEYLVNATDVILGLTGNAFLDWKDDPDMGTTDTFYYDAGDMEILHRYWVEAQPIVDDYNLAKRSITPEILNKLADLYLASFVPSNKGSLKTKLELNIQPYPVDDPVFLEAQQAELFQTVTQ